MFLVPLLVRQPPPPSPPPPSLPTPKNIIYCQWHISSGLKIGHDKHFCSFYTKEYESKQINKKYVGTQNKTNGHKKKINIKSMVHNFFIFVWLGHQTHTHFKLAPMWSKCMWKTGHTKQQLKWEKQNWNRELKELNWREQKQTTTEPFQLNQNWVKQFNVNWLLSNGIKPKHNAVGDSVWFHIVYYMYHEYLYEK